MSEQIQLPQALVLSYVSAINTPTRVRKIASVATAILGALLTIAGAVGTWYLASQFYRYFWFWGAPGPMLPGGIAVPPPAPITVKLHQLANFIIYVYPIETLLVVPLLAAPVLLFTARGVYRGRAIPSNVARAYLLVPFFQIAFLAAVFNGYGLVMAMPLHGRSEPEYLVRLLSLPFFLLPALLIVDLRNFLKWIARNPHAEKSPTPFLPGGGRG